MSLENMKKEVASGIGLAESLMSTSERRRGRAEDVVGLRFKRGSSSNSVFTVLVLLAFPFSYHICFDASFVIFISLFPIVLLWDSIPSSIGKLFLIQFSFKIKNENPLLAFILWQILMILCLLINSDYYFLIISKS